MDESRLAEIEALVQGPVAADWEQPAALLELIAALREAEDKAAKYFNTGKKVLAERDRLAALLTRVIEDSRVRHDHAYPMEFGPHHCDGCDLQADIRVALGSGGDAEQVQDQSDRGKREEN